jgi:Na+/glutamate symporter
METKLPLWQRLIITIIAMLAASYLAGLLWQWAFGFPIPSYIAGIIGGVAALPIWEFVKRIRPSGS